YRADARAATAVRNAERLVQVQVRDVGTELARLGEADHGVHVGAIEIDLTTGSMHTLADVGDRQLENTVRRRIGDHERGQTVAHLIDAALQVCDVNVAVLVGSHNHHFHAGHLRRSRIGTVSGSGNQADVALMLAARLVISANGQQTRVFALGAGVRLQADRV